MTKSKLLESKCLYYTLATFAFLIALYGLGFRQISSKWDKQFSWIQREVPSRIHFITGPIVLILGIFQFSQKLRKEKPQVHRWIGRIYTVCLLISVGTIYSIVLHSAYGLVPQISLFILNCLWLVSLLVAVYYVAVKRDIVQHRYWMIRNYAITCSAITLRIILVIFMMAINNEVAYKIACANCYFWNICFAELIIYKIKQSEKVNAPYSQTQVANSDVQKQSIEGEHNIINIQKDQQEVSN